MSVLAWVSRSVMRGTLLALALALTAAACASESDYTPQIHVVPGAAARSLWIGSKNAPDGAATEATEEGDAAVQRPD